MADFKQKIGSEIGKKLKDFSRVKYRSFSQTPKERSEVTVRHAIERLMETGKFKQIYGVIGGGKEATVLLGIWNENDIHICAKVYRYYTGTIKKRLIGTKHILPEEMASFAAKQEFKNLSILFELGFPVPEPIALMENIVIMKLISHPNQITSPAPLVKDIRFDQKLGIEEIKHLTEIITLECVDVLVRMFTEANMIHGDYSIHNLLFSPTGIYVIDLSQSLQYNINTNTDTPVRLKISRAFDIFLSDLDNLAKGIKQIFRYEIEIERIKKETISQLSPKLQGFLNDSFVYNYDRDYTFKEATKQMQRERYYKGMEKIQKRYQNKGMK